MMVTCLSCHVEFFYGVDLGTAVTTGAASQISVALDSLISFYLLAFHLEIDICSELILSKCLRLWQMSDS